MLSLPKTPDWRKYGIYAWYALIFLQPFNQFGALRLISLAALLAFLVAELFRSPRVTGNRFALSVAASIALWAILVSLLGPYPIDSLDALRKGLLIQAVMLVAALVYVRSTADVWRVATVALTGFALVTGLSLGEILLYWMRNGFSLWVTRGHDYFWGGYASTGGYYIPLLLGWLLAAPKSRVVAIAGWITLAVAAALVFLYGSRTPFLVIGAATLLLLVLLRDWKSLLAAGSVAVLVLVLIQAVPAGHLDKYKSLTQGETYVTNNGLSQRGAVWEGCLDVIRERPLTGYGYGWKKLAWAINDGGFAERWQDKPDVSGYYLSEGKAAYGKVNPHSYALQVMFEIGIVGFLLVLCFWLLVLRDGVALLRQHDGEIRKLAACLAAVFLGYALSNLSNGHWSGGLANVSLTLAGCLLALAAQYRGRG